MFNLGLTLHGWYIGRLHNTLQGSAMAQAVSRRHLTAEARARSRVSPCGICGGQSGTGTGFSPSTSVFPCQFHSTGAPLHGKTKKITNHLHHRVALYASRLLCVRSICCGALHKNNTMQCAKQLLLSTPNTTFQRSHFSSFQRNARRIRTNATFLFCRNCFIYI
jgi:hypothetical protein